MPAVPDGNTKFGAISIAKATLSGQSLLTYRLFVDGKEKWSHILTSGGTVRPRDHSHAHPQTLSFGHLKEVVKEGAHEITEEGRELAQSGEELIGRREEVAARHVEEMRVQVAELEEKLRELGRSFVGSVKEAVTQGHEAGDGSWVGRSDRWAPGWGEDHA